MAMFMIHILYCSEYLVKFCQNINMHNDKINYVVTILNLFKFIRKYMFNVKKLKKKILIVKLKL